MDLQQTVKSSPYREEEIRKEGICQCLDWHKSSIWNYVASLRTSQDLLALTYLKQRTLYLPWNYFLLLCLSNFRLCATLAWLFRMESVFQRALDQQKINKTLGEKKLARGEGQDNQKLDNQSANHRPNCHLRNKQGKSKSRDRLANFLLAIHSNADHVSH